MKNLGIKANLLSGVMISAVVLASAGVAYADNAALLGGADVAALKAQADALKKQNERLEQRLNKLEKQQTANEQRPTPQPTSAAAGVSAGAFLAQATSKGPAEILTGEGPLTWNGITLFGTIDAGLGWASYGLPTNGKYNYGDNFLNKAAQNSYFGISPSNLAQTTLGIKGVTELIPGLSGVFMASTGINPQSGQLANLPGSVADQNGLNRTAYSAFADGPRGGQPFNDQLYAGLSSPTYGQLTFGRHRSLTLEMVGNYDPAGGSPAFSFIGFNAAAVAGLGAGESGRWDDSVKYRIEYPVNGMFTGRLAAMYKFTDGSAGCNYVGVLVAPAGTAQQCFTPHNTAGQIDLGFTYGAFDFDGVLGFYNQATAVAPLSSAQLLGASTFTPNFANLAGPGFGKTVTSTGLNSNTLVGTISDNTGFAIAGKYTFQNWKFFAGWAHVIYHNPSENLGVGATNDQGDYALSTVNNAAFPHAKLLDTVWTGAKYAYNEKTDIVGSFYVSHQNAFGWAAGAPGVSASAPTSLATCSLPAYLPYGGKIGATVFAAQSAPRSATCAGNFYGASAYVDYHFTKRFDVYGGLTYSSVDGGIQSGYYSASNWAPTVGARFTF